MGLTFFRDGTALRWPHERLHDPSEQAELPRLRHLCCVRNCVNVEHMEVITRAENTRRGLLRRWGTETCIHGHKWAEHGYVNPKRPTHRRCRACDRIRNKERPTTVAGRKAAKGTRQRGSSFSLLT